MSLSQKHKKNILLSTKSMSQPHDRYKYPNVVEYNNNQYERNDYTLVYSNSNSNQLSVTNEPNIEYSYQDFYVTVSSRDRDTKVYPSVSSYSVSFPVEVKNLYSMELVQAIIPDRNDVSLEPYLLLKVDEVEDVMISADSHVSDAFAILQMAKATSPGSFIQIDKRIHENTIKYFKTPKASLSKMTVSIMDCNGNLFDFGSDDINPPSKFLQNTFVFKIKCIEKNRKSINHRNVY